MRREDPRLPEKIQRGITGEGPWKPSAHDDTAELLERAFGRGPRGGRVNTTDAAKALGVSRSSVRNWASGKAISKPNRDKLIAKARSVARSERATQKGRRKAVERARGLRPTSPGKVVITGTQGPVNTSDNMRDDRTCAAKLSPEQYQQYLDTWAEKGDEGAMSWLKEHYHHNYANDWDFGSIDSIGYQS